MAKEPMGAVNIPPKAVSDGVAQQKQLDLQIGRNRAGRSFVRHQYATYPFRLSRALQLDPLDASRTYLYLMNASPGLLAGDTLQLQVWLDDQTSLYLTDQSATKVHTMPVDRAAHTSYTLHVGAGANLELVPEPLILYEDANLEQTMQVTLDPTGRLFLSEMVVPGRLARGECYQFRHYCSRLEVTTPAGVLVVADAMRLAGRANGFARQALFAPLPILANLIVVVPNLDLQQLSQALEDIAKARSPQLRLASSPLPNCHGLLVRAMADSVETMKATIRHVLNSTRRLSGQSALPEIPK